MPKVSLFARLRATEGRGDELIAALQPVFEQADGEPGTLVFGLHRSKDDRDLFWFTELYADDDAFSFHTSSEVAAAVLAGLEDLVAESELILGEPIAVKGISRC
jgi:quinol monooxygenase YgiN